MTDGPPLDLRGELTTLLNKYSTEEVSDTPDFVLAEYLLTCLGAYETAIRGRAKWTTLDIKRNLKAAVSASEDPLALRPNAQLAASISFMSTDDLDVEVVRCRHCVGKGQARVTPLPWAPLNTAELAWADLPGFEFRACPSCGSATPVRPPEPAPAAE